MIEILCVIAIVAILAALLLPVLAQARQGAVRIKCVGQLREVGAAFHGFAHDHGSRFPMQVPARAGGSLEFARSGSQLRGQFYLSYRHFQALSNELVTPKPLACPADTRPPAARFAALDNENLSFFVGIDADYARPNSLLAGDRNITNDLAGPSSLLRLAPDQYIRWTAELHKYRGNLLFADGRVEKQDRSRLTLPQGQSPSIADLVLPSTRGSESASPVQVAAYGSAAAAPAGGLSLAATNPSRAGRDTNLARSSAPTGPPAPQAGGSNLPAAGLAQAYAPLPEAAAEDGSWKLILLLWLLLAVIVTALLLRHFGLSQRRR